jgi:hypothetical protein
VAGARHLEENLLLPLEQYLAIGQPAGEYISRKSPISWCLDCRWRAAFRTRALNRRFHERDSIGSRVP